jgi:hypothetical protein
MEPQIYLKDPLGQMWTKSLYLYHLFFKYLFKTFTSLIIIFAFFLHTLWKLSFQSEATWSFLLKKLEFNHKTEI